MIAVQLVYEEGFLNDWTFDCVNFKICFRNVKNATEIVLKIKFKWKKLKENLKKSWQNADSQEDKWL